MSRPFTSICLALSVVASAAYAQTTTKPVPADRAIQVRDGYSLSVAVEKLPGARFMALAPDNTLYVSIPGPGQIMACRDTNKDGSYETITTFIDKHKMAHGLFWHDGWLWFSQSQAILRARDTDGDGTADEIIQILGPDVLPGGSGHWWRPLLIHKNRIYTGMGDPGNITDQTNTKREKLYTFSLNGKDEELFAAGIRNTEKLVVRPGTDEIWGMDHGSDWYGEKLGEKKEGIQPVTDYNPPCEMNHYTKGGFYGHPFIVGNRMVRYEFMNKPDILELAAKTIVPQWCTGAHWAPNAMAFYTGDAFPDSKGDAFVAYHGSWNRSTKGGYCVTRVLFDDGHPYGELTYVNFIAKDGEVLARPVDVAVAADGSLLISDDKNGRIYRLTYDRQAK